MQQIIPYNKNIDLTNSYWAYFFGFVLGDGTMSLYQSKPHKRKASLSIELLSRDVEILKNFKKLIGLGSIKFRTHETNFKKSHFACLTVNRISFCDQLNSLGLPYGKKCEICNIPTVEYNEKDFWRGLIDADGSLGLVKEGHPFLSLTTKSEYIALAFKKFVKQVTGYELQTKRNNRDNVFNLCLLKEKAKQLVTLLYYTDCICLPRKLNKAKQVIQWVRPPSMIRVLKRFNWDSGSDAYCLSHSPNETVQKYGMSYNAVICRRRRLKNTL